MSVTSPFFLIGLLAYALLLFRLPNGRPRQILFAACSAAFLATYIPNGATWVALAIFVMSGFLAARVARRLADSPSLRLFLTGYLSLLLAAFLIIKKYQFLTVILPPRLFDHPLAIVGISYMLFRQIHFVVDSAEAQIEGASLWEYLNYQLNPFTLLAGPIQRFQDFRKSWAVMRPLTDDRFELLRLHGRLLMGIVKVALIGAFLLRWTEMATAGQLYITRPWDVAKFAVLFYLYPAYIYFNFSGYCDIVIAGAAIAGMRLPENFDKPYLARDDIEFWARWHITLTNWIRDYVFSPMYRAGAERWPQQAAKVGYICYFVAMFLAGMWHGASWNFLVFGLLHGAGIAAAKWREERIVKQRGRKGLREYLQNQRIRVVAIVLNLHFVCFAFLFFPPGLGPRVQFLRRFVLGRPAAMLPHTAGTAAGGIK